MLGPSTSMSPRRTAEPSSPLPPHPARWVAGCPGRAGAGSSFLWITLGRHQAPTTPVLSDEGILDDAHCCFLISKGTMWLLTVRVFWGCRKIPRPSALALSP